VKVELRESTAAECACLMRLHRNHNKWEWGLSAWCSVSLAVGGQMEDQIVLRMSALMRGLKDKYFPTRSALEVTRKMGR
jgi:hypothetical protein